jgi:hypothetical protein
VLEKPQKNKFGFSQHRDHGPKIRSDNFVAVNWIAKKRQLRSVLTQSKFRIKAFNKIKEFNKVPIAAGTV